MSPPGSHAAFDSFSEIATVRIELRGTDPVIWRQVEVPTSITLKVLHDIIQAAVEWFDCHLWEVTIDKRRYDLPMDQDWGTEPRTDAARVRLRDVLRPRKTRIDYLYDFGDAGSTGSPSPTPAPATPISPIPGTSPASATRRPRIAVAYSVFTRHSTLPPTPHTRAKPKPKKWLDDYDPILIDELPIKYALGRIANQRKAAKVRLANKKPPATTG